MKGSLAGLVALFACTLPSFHAIDTVSSLEVEKYVGRWYQLYGNEYTARITRDGTCVAADYGLDQATGNITVINSSRIGKPTGDLNTITGYAYGTDPSEPGQLKVHLGQVPVDGDYWVVGLGPDTFGPDGAYEWALVSGPEAESLFVLVRDVPEFEEKFAADVLAFVEELGFTGRDKEPQRVVQEGCLPFDPTAATARAQKKDWFDALATMKLDETDEAGPASVQGLGKAGGGSERWVDALADMGEMDEYETGLGAAPRKQDWFDALATMELGEGHEILEAAAPASEEGLGKAGWAGALATMGGIEGAGFQSQEWLDVQKNDWHDVLATMKPDEADEVPYAASDEDVNPETSSSSWADFLSKLEQAGEGAWSSVPTVSALDVNRYVGRWYQAYSSASASVLLQEDGACVTADYGVKDTTITVVNTARAQGVDGKVTKIKGTATAKNLMEPGQLTVHLEGTPALFGAPYWIVALGDEDGSGPYPWAIVSDPLRAFLFILVRDPDKFSGSKTEKVVLAKCRKLGFTSSWNSPRKTVQEGCSYTPEPHASTAVFAESSPAEGADAAAAAAAAEKPALSSVLELRGGAFGVGMPLHASCKMTINFPKNYCDEVSGALASAAEGMQGFDQCNGGMKCGYTVSKVDNGSVKLVHETSGKHYKDDLTFTLTDKEGGSCEAKAFSTSQTWYAVLDNSVNYCNLHNLVDACGLEYAESDVSDATCTQYSSADCEVY